METSNTLIEPRALKGFRDFLPAEEIERRTLQEKVERVFRSFGFVPIDTPALEYSEILLGKGGGETEKQIYRFTDNGGRDVALRFDLTVPFARYVACHRASLPFPFKRYHIAKVWRGENTQRGRYREFTQCDFDSIGVDNAPTDFEILLLIREAVRAASGGRPLTIRVNHRGLFNAFLANIGAAEKAAEVLRTVDKLAKIGEGEVKKLLTDMVGAEKTALIMDYINAAGGWDEKLAKMTALAGGDNEHSRRLADICRFMEEAEVEASFTLDPSITRGLDYYTGVVFETFLDEMPEIGSVCSGGRYDNLAGLYTKERLSGVGSSIGMDRLLAALETLDSAPRPASYARLGVFCADEAKSGYYQSLAARFRREDIPCEVFLESDKPGAEYALAEKKGLRWMIIPSDSTAPCAPLTLRDLKTRTNRENLTFNDILNTVLGRHQK